MENHYTAGELMDQVLAGLTVETGSSELVTVSSNVPRLDDQRMAELEAVANAPLPRPEPCDPAHFAKCMRSLSLLPSRADDETKGELRLAIYQRMLGNYPNGAISYLVETALAELNWFPSPKQCLDILRGWNAPITEERRSRDLAANLIAREKRMRFEEAMEALERRELTGEALDALPQRWKLIAVERGFLRDNHHGFEIRFEPVREGEKQ